jgi:hypothetical protein
MTITGNPQNASSGPREDGGTRTPLLGTCPACSRPAPADPSSIRYRGDWYHIRCATESERHSPRSPGGHRH